MPLDRLCTPATCVETQDKVMEREGIFGKGAYKADIVFNREDVLNFELMR